jgi:hypothetical protein
VAKGRPRERQSAEEVRDEVALNAQHRSPQGPWRGNLVANFSGGEQSGSERAGFIGEANHKDTIPA